MNNDSLRLPGIGRLKVNVKIEEMEPHEARDGQTSNLCQVCHEKQSRYACPRCEISYCSLSCYKRHGSEEGASCTENFYRNQVAQNLDLEVKEKREDTLKILQRVHDENPETHVTPLQALSEEQALKLMNAIENGDDEAIEAMLASPALRTAFEAAAISGQLNEWILEPWHPWWRAELVGNGVDDESGDEEDATLFDLDERLHALVPFDSLKPKSKVPDLRPNLFDIVSSIAECLKLYHGCPNAMESAREAANTLTEASFVLSKDARYGRYEEVLVRLSQQNAPVDSLLEDVELICRSRRMVFRCLFEAIDILSAAKPLALSPEEGRQFKLSRRKLDYYSSWLLSDGNLSLEEAADCIVKFKIDWKIGPGEAEDDDGLRRLLDFTG